MYTIFTRDDITATRRDYTATAPTANGERLVVELIRCEDSGGRSSLPALWAKAGYTRERLSDYWAVSTYATEQDGSCWGRYNPTVKAGTHRLDFDWVLPATEENAERILAEIARRAGLPLSCCVSPVRSDPA